MRKLFLFLTIVLILPLLTILFLFTFSSGQDKPTAAVMDLEAKTGIDQRTSELLSDSLRSSLFKTNIFDLVTRENMEAILNEQKFQLSGCTSTECVVKVGKLLGAQKIFSGTIGKVGATYTITLKLLDVETGRFERIEEDRCPRCEEDSLLDSIDNLTARITGTPETSTPREPARPVARGQKEITAKDNSPMVLIPAGEFLMGSPQSEDSADEHPQHKVFLDAYYIDKYEVTVAQYRKFCETTGRNMPTKTPSWGWQDNHPMIYVTWYDAVAYANYYGKRLPTEAEWEKACRAGSTTRYCFGDAEMDLSDYAWYPANSNDQTHPIGTKKPNAFGLYDMSGNAWEWCSDRYDENYYANSPKDNPQGPTSGTYRVARGGSWLTQPLTALNCRSADRLSGVPSVSVGMVGFRCASSP